MKSDIRDVQDIRILIDSFYLKAGQDELLGSIFSRVHSAHLQKETLYRYWTSVLLDETAGAQQFPSHIEQMFSRQHFIRWLNLFLEAIDTLYSGERAAKAKVLVIRKSEEFQSKLALSRF